MVMPSWLWLKHNVIVAFARIRCRYRSGSGRCFGCCASTARWSSSVERACVAVIIAVDEVLRLDLDDDAVLAIAEA